MPKNGLSGSPRKHQGSALDPKDQWKPFSAAVQPDIGAILFGNSSKEKTLVMPFIDRRLPYGDTDYLLRRCR